MIPVCFDAVQSKAAAAVPVRRSRLAYARVKSGSFLLGVHAQALVGKVGDSAGVIADRGHGSGKVQVQFSGLAVGQVGSVLKSAVQEVVHVLAAHVVTGNNNGAHSHGGGVFGSAVHVLGNGVLAVVGAGGDKRIETLLDDEAQYIPAETRNYIRTILAMSLLFNDVDFLRAQNVDYLLNRGVTDSIASVSVKGGISLSAIAKSAKIPLNELQKYNRHFTRSILPPGNRYYNVYLPYDKLRIFKQNFKEDYPESVFVTHIVQKGESLSVIAQNYKVSIKELQDINGIKGSHIRIDQKLTIPVLKGKKATIADGR